MNITFGTERATARRTHPFTLRCGDQSSCTNRGVFFTILLAMGLFATILHWAEFSFFRNDYGGKMKYTPYRCI